MELSNINEIATANLVAIYNHFSDKPVKKFRDRRTTEQRAVQQINNSKIYENWNEKFSSLHVNLKKFFQEEDNSNDVLFDRLTMKEKATMKAIYHSGLSDVVTIEEVTAYMDADLLVVNQVLTRLRKKGIVKITKGIGISNEKIVGGEKVQLLNQAFNWVVRNAAEEFIPSKLDMKTRDFEHPGPRSKFSGKRIYKLVEKNPHREGTYGWYSWRLVFDGITFEQYRQKGGRNRDLKWDVSRKYVEVK